MKSVSLILFAFLVALGLLAPPANAQTGVTPYIFTVTETGLPGDVIGLQGDNFGTAPQVWLTVVDSTTPTNPVPGVQLTQIASASNKMIAVRIPGNQAMGIYALFVKNTASGIVSRAAYVNKPQIWQALDLAGTNFEPNRVFRVTGRNLSFPGATPTVRFLSVNTGASLPAQSVTKGDDQYLLTIQGPSSVSGDAYYIMVSNGYGGTQGEVQTILIGSRTGGADPLGLNVPWAADFNTILANVYDVKADSRLTLKATGNGTTNDAPAIQAAIDKANAAGGGVVYFPAGTYNVAGTVMTMRSKVVLRGAGKDLSIIYDNAGAARTDDPGMFTAENREWWQPGVCTRIGVVDLQIKTGTSGFTSTWKVGGQGPSFIVRSKLSNPLKAVLVYGTNNMLLQDSTIIHTAPNQKNVLDWAGRWDVLMRNNYIEWADGRVHMNTMKRLQMENNQMIRSVKTDGAGVGYGGPALGYSSEVTLLGNTFGKLGDGKIPQNNDGETILNENVSRIAVGKATGGTATTMADSSRTWTTNAMVGYSVMIIQGPGMGQRREISASDAKSITVSQAWDVVPTAASYYSIVTFDTHYLIKNNILQTVPRGIWIYTCNMDQAAIVGNQLLDGDKIWLRADQRISEARFAVQRNFIIEKNLMRNTLNWYGAQILIDERYIDGAELMGTAFYNIVCRDNRVEAHIPNYISSGDGSWSEGFFSHVSASVGVDNDTAATLGTIWQRNTSLNVDYAYRINTGSYQTVIWDAVATNSLALKFDDWPTGATHGSVGTVVGYSPNDTVVDPPVVVVPPVVVIPPVVVVPPVVVIPPVVVVPPVVVDPPVVVVPPVVIPPVVVPAALTLVRASSRRVHGDGGTYDIDLPLTGTMGIECRATVGGAVTLVLQFSDNITDGTVAVSGGVVMVSAPPTISGNTMTVELTAAPNGQIVTITAQNVLTAAGVKLDSADIKFGLLAGDVDGNGVVDSADTDLVKANSSAGIIGSDNFRSDVTANGTVNSSDILTVKFMRPTTLQ